MKWIEICVESDRDITEEASYSLMELGASGTRIQNPDEIKSLIEQAGASELASPGDFSNELQKYRVTAYFPVSKNFEKLKGALKSKFPDAEVLFREADDSEWKGNWKKYYKSFNLTSRIRVIPSWEAKGEPTGNEIIMDPGMAFGTGTHESTELCAGLVESCIAPGDSFLDIGTGTGILSIVANKSGADDILALDVDEAAVKAAGDNLKLNGVSNARIFHGELVKARALLSSEQNRAPFMFDVVAANIVSDIIIELSPDIKKILKKGGRFVCSGIITEREKDVLAKLESDGYEIVDIKRKNEWTAILAHA